MMFQLPGGPLVRVYMDDITSIKTDAVVCTGNKTLDSKQGLNFVVLKCAGKSIVNEIRNKINSSSNRSLTFGDVIVTSSGGLACKYIIHTVNVMFKNPNDSNELAVQKVVRVCLEKANEKRFHTVAFPAIGTGQSRIRHTDCINAYSSVLKSWKHPYPKEIHFVIKSRMLLEEIQVAFTCSFLSKPSAAPRKRKTKASPVIDKTPAANASGGSSLPHSSATTQKLQTNHSAMANESAAKASEVAFLTTVTSEQTESSDSCPICLCDFTDRKTLDKCGHSFCTTCIDHSFSAVGPSCPICQTVYGKVIGLQPPGTMIIKRDNRSLPGFPECQFYKVDYQISSGIQKKGHPKPGLRFLGTHRTAYLPSNGQGIIVLKMLQRAFEQKLIFTVGDSRTSNKTDVVTWNDIHHKTNIMGGPSRYGYPDPEYLNRVTLELEAKGIKPADVFDEEIKFKISN